MKILFVDDEQAIRELFEETFHKDYELLFADNGESAFEICLNQKIDLIISDINLPKLNGVEFLRKLREENLFIPFVIISGNPNIDHAIDTFRMGAVDFFLKPFRIGNLKEIIEKIRLTHIEKNDIVISNDLTHEKETSNYILSPKIREINQYVSYICNRIVNLPNVGEEDVIAVKVALYELIANAIEHGTAGIDYQEKKNCLENNDDYFKLVDRKCATSEKKIIVRLSYSKEKIEIEIEDEGNGFDLSQVPNPIVDPTYNLYSGRGIFLTKMNTDLINFNSKGNIVKVIRNLHGKISTKS
jgi:CheY-like chemotaxis protein